MPVIDINPGLSRSSVRKKNPIVKDVQKARRQKATEGSSGQGSDRVDQIYADGMKYYRSKQKKKR